MKLKNSTITCVFVTTGFPKNRSKFFQKVSEGPGSDDQVEEQDNDNDFRGVDSDGDEEFEELLEKYNVDEIEEKPKHFYSPFCNRWISISGVRYSKFCLIRHPYHSGALEAK